MGERCTCGHLYREHSISLPMCLGGAWCECRAFLCDVEDYLHDDVREYLHGGCEE